jgi:hypothetical protein
VFNSVGIEIESAQRNPPSVAFDSSSVAKLIAEEGDNDDRNGEKSRLENAVHAPMSEEREEAGVS